MTQCTGIIMNCYYNFATMTGSTRCICRDRRISQPTRRVRCMVVVAVVYGLILIRMTIQTMSRIGTQGYCINNLLTRAVVTGGAGTRTVGSDIVLGLDIIPGQ